LSANDKTRIELYARRQQPTEATSLLRRTIGPLIYRVRKRDLGLAPQHFNAPTVVKMNEFERRIYDAITDRVRALSKQDYFRDLDVLTQLRRGRMMRLRQAVSYPKLLGSAIAEYDENVLPDSESLVEIIRHYDELETPAKMTALLAIVRRLREGGEKIVVWSNFIATLHLIVERLTEAGHGVGLIYGDVPTQSSSLRDELTREKIIAQFLRRDGGMAVLVANPAACAESISLHKTCSHAIYYDLSYNCAQYLQSLDRIHRVGGSEDKPAHYFFLQSAETIDADILHNLQAKAERMSNIIDEEFPIYSLDMFSSDEEIEAYGRLFK
jgi:SNF2 family DNA or RNA helicase